MTYRDAVLVLTDRLADTDVDWAVTASANLALRGFPVTPGDVDLMTTADGTARIASVFTNRVSRPIQPPEQAQNGNIRSYYGALEIGGTEVEIMGDVEHRIDDTWQQADDVATTREFLSVEGRRVPAMPLDHERRAYRAIGRDERVALIAEGAP